MRQRLPPGKSPLGFRLWSLGLSLLIAGCAGAEKTVQSTQVPPSASEPGPELSVPAAPPATVPPLASTSAEAALWAELAQADEETYVVVLRHAIAPGTGDPANFQLNDCATQRNLSEAGRQQAIAIGEAFRSHDIPVIEVLSSQWCRCLETAELMDIGPVEPFAPLNSFFRDRSTADAQTAQIQAYVTAQSRPGVVVMVTHQVNVTALSGVFPQSGSAVVLQLADGALTVAGQLPAPSS